MLVVMGVHIIQILNKFYLSLIHFLQSNLPMFEFKNLIDGEMMYNIWPLRQGYIKYLF
jgi:hypothetical protein